LSTKNNFFKPQNFSTYPFNSRLENTQRWSSAVKLARISPQMSRYGAYLNRINSLSKKFRSKVRLFPLSAFKSRLNISYDFSKQKLSKQLYFQRFLLKSFPLLQKTKAPLFLVKKDKFLKKWDKNQFYANPINKEPKRHYFNKNKSNFKYNNSKKKFLTKSGFNKSENNYLKKPLYRDRFRRFSNAR